MRNFKVNVTIGLALIISLVWVTLANAQEQAGWSAPIRLSSEEGKASEGFMVADQFGYVHVFWIEHGFLDQRMIIQYARFDGETWSAPLDIYATQPTGQIEYLSPVVDQNGRLHLIWTGGSTGPIFYTSAPAHDALSAQQWSSPVRIDAQAYRARLTVDSNGYFHVLYANFFGETPGVYYIRSEDEGMTWSEPYWLDPDIPDNQAPQVIQLALDEDENLHAVWFYLDLNSLLGTQVRYAHSFDGGQNWSLPMTIDEADESPDEVRLPYPLLATQGQTVHIIWAGDSSTHREHRISTDSGQTWGVTNRILGDLLGQAIGGGLAEDAAGRLHYLTQVRNPKAIWHSYWDQDHWSTPSMAYLIARFDGDPMEAERIHAHHVRLAIRAGNQLVITFTNSPGEGDDLVLYSMHRTLDDLSPLVAAPTPTARPSATPMLEIKVTPMQLVPTSTSTPPGLLNEKTASAAANNSSLAETLWVGLLPSLLLIGGVIVFRLAQKR